MGNLMWCGHPAGVVKVVHLNGVVDEFPTPLRVSQLSLLYPRHFICHSDDLRLAGHPAPALALAGLPDCEELQLGQIYFLLPRQTPLSLLSESDLASLTTAIAAPRRTTISHRKQALVPLAPRSLRMKQNRGSSSLRIMIPRELIARLLIGSTNKCTSKSIATATATQAPKSPPNVNICDTPELQAAYTNHVVAKNCSAAWKPRLETIHEGSRSCLGW